MGGWIKFKTTPDGGRYNMVKIRTPPPPPLKQELELEAPLKIRHLRLVVLFDAAEMLGIHS